jgi:hypothetical protein
MDLFRLFKSKSFYITLIIYAIILWFVLDVMSFSGNTHVLRDSWDAYHNFRLQLINPELWKSENKIENVVNVASSVLSGLLVIFFTGIYTILFVSSEESSRFIKNVVSGVKKRRFIILSKIMIMSIFIAMEFIILIIIIELSSFTGARHIGHTITFEQLRYIGLTFLLYIAFSTSIILLAYTVKNAAISMMINIFICFQLGTAIMLLLLKFFGKILKTNLIQKVANYSVMTNINLLSTNAPAEICFRGMIVAIAAILIYSRLSIIVIERRDI